MAPLVIRHIRDPLWTKPAVVAPASSFPVVLDLLEGDLEHLSVSLTDELGPRPLTIHSLRTVHGGRYLELTLEPDAGIPPGLYDLRLEWKGGTEVMPGSVWLTEPDVKDFRFVHLADPHMASIDDEPGWGLERAVEQINLLAPDFALLTGDVVTRYGPPGRTTLTGEMVERDMLAVQELLLQLEVPFFLTAGNHDLGFAWCRQCYRRYMSRPLAGPTQDYAFSYGGMRFITYEAYRDAGPRLEALPPQAPTPEQEQWVKHQLEAAQDARARVLFFHYDYGKWLEPLYDAFNVNLALFGHTKPWGVDSVGTTPTTTILDRPNRRSGHFRLIEVRNGKFDVTRTVNRELVPDARALTARWWLPNDGRTDRNAVEVENHTDYSFPGLRLTFGVSAGEYAVNGGQIVQLVQQNGRSRCTVGYELGPGERRIISLRPDAGA